MNKSERNPMIYKKLKYHLNELKRLRPQYTFVMIALQGSQNYNLDMYTDKYQSDVDSVAIVLPTVQDFINNDKMISETLILDNNEHIDCKDLRLMFELFRKQNIKYLEVLFTNFRIINPLFRMEIRELFNYNEDIAHFDIDKLIRTTFGMAKEKQKALEHPYEGLKEKIAKYGYDGKQLHHIIRLYSFLKNYCMNGSFGYSIDANNYTEEIRKLLDNAKLNKFSLDEARNLANEYIYLITSTREEFEGKLHYKYFFNKDVEKILNDIQYKIFEKYFKDLFEVKLELSDGFIDTDPNHYKNVFVTSDIHFCHENILGFEDGRWNLLGINKIEAITHEMIEDGYNFEQVHISLHSKDDLYYKYLKLVEAKYIDQHDEAIIRLWNQTVGPKDLVYILGDLTLNYKDIEKVNDLISRLNGIKVLIIGNHDSYTLQNKRFNKSLFAEIVDYKEIKYKSKYISLFHYPIASFNKQDNGGICLYGHIHSNKLNNPIPHAYNVGMDVNNYRPVDINNFIKLDNLCDIKTDRHSNI